MSKGEGVMLHNPDQYKQVLDNLRSSAAFRAMCFKPPVCVNCILGMFSHGDDIGNSASDI